MRLTILITLAGAVAGVLCTPVSGATPAATPSANKHCAHEGQRCSPPDVAAVQGAPPECCSTTPNGSVLVCADVELTKRPDPHGQGMILVPVGVRLLGRLLPITWLTPAKDLSDCQRLSPHAPPTGVVQRHRRRYAAPVRRMANKPVFMPLSSLCYSVLL